MINDSQFFLVGLPICFVVAIITGVGISFLTYQKDGFSFMTVIVVCGGFPLGLFIGACLQGWK